MSHSASSDTDFDCAAVKTANSRPSPIRLYYVYASSLKIVAGYPVNKCAMRAALPFVSPADSRQLTFCHSTGGFQLYIGGFCMDMCPFYRCCAARPQVNCRPIIQLIREVCHEKQGNHRSLYVFRYGSDAGGTDQSVLSGLSPKRAFYPGDSPTGVVLLRR